MNWSVIAFLIGDTKNSQDICKKRRINEILKRSQDGSVLWDSEQQMKQLSIVTKRRGYLFLKIFFDVDHFLKVFIEFITKLFLFHILVFGLQVCVILVPWLEMEPAPSALEDGVLTTGPSGKSQNGALLKVSSLF